MSSITQDKVSQSAKRYRVNIPQANNFDLLRFSFAAMVFLVHAYQLSGAGALSILGGAFSSSLAVQCFFVVSGFLIFMSYEHSSGIGTYFEKRIRRIYPAYFTVVVLCALLGSFVSTYSFSDYFLSSDLYRYLVANLIFLNFVQPDLPGVFGANKLDAVNGALWTLKIEVMFYLSVPLLVWFFRKVGLWQGLLSAYLASFIYSFVMSLLIEEHGGIYVELQRQLPGQLMYFIAGGALYYYFDIFKTYAKVIAFAALLGYLLEYLFNPGILHAAVLAVIVVHLGFVFRYLGNFGKYGDFSYGVYILHFPILQTLIAYQLFTYSPYMAMGLAVILVMLTAALMWYWVEKPMLKKSSHYLLANDSRNSNPELMEQCDLSKQQS